MVKKARQQQQKPQKKRQNPKAKPTNGGRRPVDMEVGIKLPCDEQSWLVDAGLDLEVVEDRHFEDNWVYKLPDGKLRKRQYLRVRYVGDGDGAGRRHEGKLTYKGKS